MFNWLPSTCPCHPVEKAWIESRFEWLCREFPFNVLNGRPMVLPVRDFFPVRYDPSPESVEALVERVCEYMEVSPDVVSVRIHHDPQKLWLVNARGNFFPHAAGTYESDLGRHLITFDTDQLAEPFHLVATIAHELSHARLLGEQRLRQSSHDNELLTDLTAVALGFGVFLANSPRVWTSQFSHWPPPNDVVLKPEYMTPPMYGYAMALVAWCQGEKKPKWARFLGPRVKTDYKQAMKFLFKTGDSTFRSAPLRIEHATRENGSLRRAPKDAK
ncbi:MAG TPA: hypothetical protein VFV34_18390 [Blastocatellia bacterium]|nr:hypothetical protein [Blastocatellia bacterium]